MTQLAPTPRTKLKRRAQRGSFDRAVVNAILDEGFVCSVAFLHDGKPCVIPTLYARGGDFLILHGSPANRHAAQPVRAGPRGVHLGRSTPTRWCSRAPRSTTRSTTARWCCTRRPRRSSTPTRSSRRCGSWSSTSCPDAGRTCARPNLEEFRGTLVLRAPDRRGLGQDPRPGRDRRRGGPPARLLGGAAPDGDPLRDSRSPTRSCRRASRSRPTSRATRERVSRRCARARGRTATR